MVEIQMRWLVIDVVLVPVVLRRSPFSVNMNCCHDRIHTQDFAAVARLIFLQIANLARTQTPSPTQKKRHETCNLTGHWEAVWKLLPGIRWRPPGAEHCVLMVQGRLSWAIRHQRNAHCCYDERDIYRRIARLTHKRLEYSTSLDRGGSSRLFINIQLVHVTM